MIWPNLYKLAPRPFPRPHPKKSNHCDPAMEAKAVAIAFALILLAFGESSIVISSLA